MKTLCHNVLFYCVCIVVAVLMFDCSEQPKEPTNLAVEYSAPQAIQRIRHTTFNNSMLSTDSLLVSDIRMVNGKNAVAVMLASDISKPLYYEAQDWQGLHIYQHPLPELSGVVPVACTERWVRYSTHSNTENCWVNIDTTVVGAPCTINDNRCTIDARITSYTARNSNCGNILPVACTEYVRVTTVNGTVHSAQGNIPVQWKITRNVYCSYQHGIEQAIQEPTVLDAGALGKLTVSGIQTSVRFYVQQGKSLAIEK
ncbi:MAG: hypothetical protein U0Y96_02120 [Candidatus Kapaibacterium sp.]